MQTIVELPEYLRKQEGCLAMKKSRASSMHWHESRKPKAEVLITGTGGIRKLRWVRPGTGKSGGVRVIYYYHNQSMPLFLLTLFAKGEKSNLSKSERNELAQLAQILRSHYEGKRQ